MTTRVVVGVDIGTSSSKGVLTTFKGAIVATATREHAVSRPSPGWVEMDPWLWWSEFSEIVRELLEAAGAVEVVAVGVSGMGPCLAVTDARGLALRPAILYGIDTRATTQIVELNAALGENAILKRSGSSLSTQAVGPKLAWIKENEPDVFSRIRRFYMPSSWLVFALTGNYILDHHSASQSTPLYDTDAQAWYEPWARQIAPQLELPRLLWADQVAGRVLPEAASATGLPIGIPVIAGTIDAWAEAASVGADNTGDLMLMYGTTMFLVNTTSERITFPALWGTVGARAGTRSLAGGMATSGAITAWLRDLFGSPAWGELLAEAADTPAGSDGLLMLPYFAGERTPIADPDARGVIAGLTVSHSRGAIYRAALEATAYGVRHNIEAIRAAGGRIDRVVAVGGGTQGGLWTQIVSDVTGLPQLIPSLTIGASLGAAFLAASSQQPVSIAEWNPIKSVVEPRSEHVPTYEEFYEFYRRLYDQTKSIVHNLAREQTRSLALTADRSPSKND